MNRVLDHWQRITDNPLPNSIHQLTIAKIGQLAIDIRDARQYLERTRDRRQHASHDDSAHEATRSKTLIHESPPFFTLCHANLDEFCELDKHAT